MALNIAKKRAFDLVVCLVTMPFWLPILAMLSLINLVMSGRPVFYRSERRVFRNEHISILKFRTMVPNASVIANRETIPVQEQRFLNIPTTSPLYTPVGRFFEKFSLTELPQILHVLTGHMSLVGNRPLPENVICSLKESHPNVEERFFTRAGLTGFAQVMNRYHVTDEIRLHVEAAYCQFCIRHYSARMDLYLLFYTFLFVLKLKRPLLLKEVEGIMAHYTPKHSHKYASSVEVPTHS